jgi:hypothetical protein
VGLGTTSPAAKLDIVGGAYPGAAGEPTFKGVIRIQDALGTTGQNGGLEFKLASSGAGYGWRITAPDLGTGESPLYIQNRVNSASWSNQLTILNNGNVGIGSATPVHKLDVAGNIGLAASS